MPVNTNKHYSSQFLKGVYTVCICSDEFKSNSPDFARDVVDSSPIPATIIYFDTLSSDLLEYHCFNPNSKAIYHFISHEKKSEFTSAYESIDDRIQFEDFKFDEDQVCHLKYRCEDTYHSIHKGDIKKAKIKKINQELLNSKNMQDYFKSNPEEKTKIIKAIQENSIKGFKPSASFLPSYLIHQEIKDGTEGNIIEQAINNNYAGKLNESKKKVLMKMEKRKKKGKMEKYLEGLEKNDGTHEEIKF